MKMAKVAPSTKQSKYSNCTVTPSKTPENQKVCFHHHRTACLIHYFDQGQMSLLMHVHDQIQNLGQSDPGIFINQVRATCMIIR